MQGQGQKSVGSKREPVWISRILPPPSRKPTSADSGMVDYLSGDVYKTERFSGASGSIHTAVPDNSNNRNPVHPPSPMLSSTPLDFINPTASMFAPKPAYKEPVPTSKSADQLPRAPWDVLSPNVIPPPPSRYNRRQQFFEEQHVYGGGLANSSSVSGSYDFFSCTNPESLNQITNLQTRKTRRCHF
ncbi:unnamed protein product [Fraxinus pennsylvanica]|uniref:Uncharacterized protein n=1 Tax=Fraxinus pennsylvanica TaxID=56036 RepID=A0AAD1ZYS7_9LAMI|nr:unnamed protein product [Fraxinus pennsylvanica]